MRPIAERLSEAVIIRNRGNFHAAIRFYDELLKDDECIAKVRSEVLNGKGVCHKNIGDHAMAMACYDAVLEVDPEDWCAHNNRGVLYKDAGFIEDAIRCYLLAVQLNPKESVPKENLAVALTEKGPQLRSIGMVDRALETLLLAIQYHPKYAPAYFNLGFLFSESGKIEAALEEYFRAIEIAPDYPEALCNIGVIYKNVGRIEDAITFYERALVASPNFEVVKGNLAIAYTDLGTKIKTDGDLLRSVFLYKKALTYNSKYSHAWYNLGVAHGELNSIDDAIICYEISIQTNPDFAEAHNNLGVIAKDKGNYERSLMHYEAALRINPRFSQTLNNMGVIYTMIGRMDEGLHYCQLAIKYNPQYAEAHNNLGVLYRDEGRIDEAIQNYEKCCELNPSSKNASQNRLLALNYSPKFSTEFVSEQHRIWGIKFSKTFERLPKINARNARGVNERLRIGYVSPDFCTHSVSYFIEAPLLHADKTKFEVYCYSNLSKGDSRTEYFKTLCKNWREISHLSTLDACKIIMEDEIDILIDLTGHTAGNRLDIFAMKPAPIQATWIGYPNSTGLETVDVRITDGIVDAHDTKQTFVENLFRLPGPFLCYSHPHSMPPVSAPPCSNYGFVTFGSFNNLAKITSEVIALWSRVVLAVPRSRMLLKSKAFATKNVRDRIMKYFAENGVSEDRIDLFPLLSKTGDHLSLYSSIDIALDTFPYAGTTTTCESLIMGVPVITLTGQIHAQNVGKTLLTRIESLKFCIAATPEDYVKKAVSLANDPIRLKEIRHKMREACISSDLCNGKQFTQRLEAAFLSMQFKALDM